MATLIGIKNMIEYYALGEGFTFMYLDRDEINKSTLDHTIEQILFILHPSSLGVDAI
ncbi:unnamed protein product, partial [marine sediment metagenome]